ncbi:OLC1v1037939C1 [Oldenlandia corymbosa var. corymbosa]|uniref:OLC1v1037939C1 n=1 Tax=Oldenlandia corymbosa var. corymbosa TaxID=529605 RepID=A0AAV1D1S8_OLDCO|nr:OLC1v1037939C1 [Oldenlandia corymbosa var. corymbosa]
MVKSRFQKLQDQQATSSSTTTTTSSERSCNSVDSSSSSTKYKGVRKRKWGKYVSEIRLPNSRARIWLGSYDTAEKAAKAFDAALFCLRGKSAKFNFPDNPPDIVNGRSMSSAEIQVAAARFANSEQPDDGARVDHLAVSDHSSSSTSSEIAESPCPSVSDGVVNLESELPEIPLDTAFLDTFSTMGWDVHEGNNVNSNNHHHRHNNNDVVADFGIFPGFDDFFAAPIPTLDSYGEENCDGFYSQDSATLWNFC